MQAREIETIRALRSDLALQIARHVERQKETQLAAAKRLAIPQPTLSKIMNGRVTELSLELLLRIAVRARLPVVLQTGSEPAEAGAFVSGTQEAERRRHKSIVAEQAREAVAQSAWQLTPEQRLEAHLKHTELVTALHEAGRAHHAGRSAVSGKRSR
jgi:predicted XRE-type DNA-binding protein